MSFQKKDLKFREKQNNKRRKIKDFFQKKVLFFPNAFSFLLFTIFNFDIFLNAFYTSFGIYGFFH